MKSNCSIPGLPGACFVVWLAAHLGPASFASPIPLPDWAKPIESSLPKLSPEVISEVDDIYEFFFANNDRLPYPGIRDQWNSNERRLFELREQADLAMIWQYLKATNSKYYNIEVLGRLANDRNLAARLLPVVRWRIEWLKKASLDGSLELYYKTYDPFFELYDTRDYLMKQGEWSDIEGLNSVKDATSKLGIPIFDVFAPMDLYDQVDAMHVARKDSEQNDGPFWQTRARWLIKEGVLSEDALKPRPSVINPADGPKPLGPRKPLPEITKPSRPTEFLQAWMVWPMWILIGIVSLGLLRWLFRKPRC
jgi:hypothetical protein